MTAPCPDIPHRLALVFRDRKLKVYHGCNPEENQYGRADEHTYGMLTRIVPFNKLSAVSNYID